MSAADTPTAVREPMGVEPSASAPQWRPGVTIGRYLPIDEVGRGGMGIVLRAYDPRLQREVALKILRREAMSAESSARLVREARAMAKLAHPNVVAVYDVEAESEDAVTLVMEYVDGTTLRQWITDGKPTWSRIVQQFVAAGRGLAAAHEAGLLHRDFKPGNVLVGRDGRVRVTDFGLARPATSTAGLTGTTGEFPAIDHLDPGLSVDVTTVGMIMGTPAYMAPEQHRSAELTAAADQYAFCVSLWEALTGLRPFTGRNLAAVKRAGPPEWPANIDVPRPIVDAMRRGLAPEPEQRFATMEALLAALTVDPDARRTTVRRASVVVLVAGFAAAAWFLRAPEGSPCAGAGDRLADAWDDTRREAVQAGVLATGVSYAEAAWRGIAPRLDAYAAQWKATRVDACEATRVRGEQSDHVLDLRLACLDRARTELAATTDLLARADALTVERAQQLVNGLPDPTQCTAADVLASVVPPPNADQTEVVAAMREELAAAAALGTAGRYAEARLRLEDLVARGGVVGYGPLQTELARALGMARNSAGAYELGEAALLDALTSALRWQQWNEARIVATDLVFVSGFRRRDFARSDAFYVVAQGLATRPGARELDLAQLRSNHGSVLHRRGMLAEAEAEQRATLEVRTRLLPPGHLDIASEHNNLGNTLVLLHRHGEAEQEYRTALALREQAHGPEHPVVAATRSNLANALAAAGRTEEAVEEHRAALRIRQHTLGEAHPETAASHVNLGNVLSTSGHYVEAEAEHRIALAIRLRELGPAHADVAQSHNNLGTTLAEMGRVDEALSEFRLAYETWTRALPPEHPDLARSRSNLATAMTRAGDLEGALREQRGVLAMREAQRAPEPLELAASHHEIGLLLLRTRDPAAAVDELRRAWDLAAERERSLALRGVLAFDLADALRAAGQHASAREMAGRARALQEAAGASKAVDEIDAWLAAEP